MRLRKVWLPVCAAFFVAACAGCGGGLVPVEGKMTLDGKPLEGAYVVFFPVGASVNDPTMFSGLTDARGHYEMRGRGGGPIGVLPGKYRVTLTTAVAGPNDNENTPLPPERIPAKYRDEFKEFEVPEGGTKDANFDMKSR
jgi:hypothetical protein